MKKILSLLSMLMITVTAFATSYMDKLTYKLTVFTALTKDLPAGELTIEPYGTSNYTVTAKGCDLSDFDAGNWDEIVCEDVAGTKDANGVTTITLDNPYAYRTSDNTSFSNTKLVVKFNGTKAYAHFEGKIKIGLASRAFEYTFGTDEGFESTGGSTGGGETGGEDKPAIVDVVAADYAPNGAAFGFRFTINWQTQKLVAKLDLSTCSRNTHNEGIITVGTSNGSGDISLWNPNAGEANCHLYYTHYYYGTDEKQLNLHYLENPSGKVNRVDNSIQNLEPGLVVFTFDKEGLHVGDNLIATPDQMSTLYNSTSLIFGSKEGSTRSNATYKYVKVVPLDWTETTEPTEPEVTVVATKKFDAIDYSNTWSQAGTANVAFEEMSDGNVKMKFATDGINISADALKKGTDDKDRTTYTGEAVNDAMSTLTYTIKAVVYTEGTKEKLYMTMEANSGVTFTVGTDPDYVAPEPPAGESTIVENWKSTEGTSWSHDVTIDWNTQKLVVSVNLASTGSDKGFLGVTKKGNTPGWNNDGIIFYNVDGTTVQGYAPGQPNNANTNYVTKGEDPVRFEISKDGGVKCQGNVVISSALIAHLTNQSNIVVGAADKVAGALYNYIKVVSFDWKETTEPEVTVKDEKTFNEALYMGGSKAADAKVVVKEMSDNTVNMSLQFSGYEYTSTELAKGTDEKNRTTYTGKVAKDEQTYDVKAVVYEKDNVERLYMTMTTSVTTVVVGENPDAVTPEVTVASDKTYTSNLRIFDGEEPVVENADAKVNIIKYSDESYKVTLKNVNMLNKTQDLVFVGKALIEEAPTEATEPLTIIAKSDAATTEFFGEEMSATFEITEVSAEEIKMGFVLNNTSLEYQGEFNYTEEETPEVYTNNLHIYDAAAPETDLFQADQAKVEFLATATGGFKLTLKDVTLNEKTQDLVFTGTLPTPQPGGQDPLAEEGETTPAEPAMVLNATADEATATFLGTTSATAVFNVIMNDEAETENDAFALTFTITAGDKTLGGEFNYKKKTPDTPDPELFCKENYVADGEGFEWEIAVDWDTQKIVMSIDPSTCTGGCEDVIGLGAVPTAWDNTLHLYRTSADQQLQGYFQTSAGNNNTGKFAETTPFLVEVSKAQGFVVNNEVKIASSAMSYLFTLPTVKMGTGEGANDKSRATYNYVKVVDKDWTAPKDPDTGINATTVAEGEVEFFTVNGVKLNKLQKGLNIVRTADGKVKKVLVK
ncbi:hypothetical protein [Leyella stercorea]|uniref:hypothetical protein n=1 Tax=Leyella stercorea TaxID=363265 RepID=UPI003A8F8574